MYCRQATWASPDETLITQSRQISP
ncbi:hypothetical protein A2U01_0116716, partial [Trifolium medium]|nr:hypothetical protein [Trifolium medium]